MQLLIDGEHREFIPIKIFRDAYDLPDGFGVAFFEPKDYTGLGSIEQKGAALNDLRQQVLESIPAQLSPQQWLNFLPTLQKTFRRHLMLAGTGLRESEIEFAVAGLANVCQAIIYARLRVDTPAFDEIYADWLQNTVRLSQTRYPYGSWQVQIVTHAFGRVGMVIQAENDMYYVLDNRLACPAESFMRDLLREIAQFILI
jgi:hypothetical protein